MWCFFFLALPLWACGRCPPFELDGGYRNVCFLFEPVCVLEASSVGMLEEVLNEFLVSAVCFDPTNPCPAPHCRKSSRPCDVQQLEDHAVLCEVFGEVVGEVFGEVFGEVLGEVFGEVVGEVFGEVLCDFFGEVFGEVFCEVFGEAFGEDWGRVKQVACNPCEVGREVVCEVFPY